jgi:uncharacterized paraquat-inducible protein A
VNRRKTIGWALVATGFLLTFFTPQTKSTTLSVAFLAMAFVPFAVGLYLTGFSLRRKDRGRTIETKKVYAKQFRICPRCKQKLKVEKTRCDKCGAKLPDLSLKKQ